MRVRWNHYERRSDAVHQETYREVNMWFGKFAALLYIAYLNCERELRDIAMVLIAMVLILFCYAISLGYLIFDLPQPLYFIIPAYTDIALFNLGIALILSFQVVISVLYCSSFLRVAYVYDLKSWGSVKTIIDFAYWFENTTDELFFKLNDQLDKDREEKLIKGLMHDKKIELMINKIRD